MTFNYMTDSRNDGGYVPTFLKVSTLRIEDGFQFFHQERDFATLPKHCRDHSRQRHHPLKVLHRFRVDEDFKRTPMFVLSPTIQQNVGDGDVECIRVRWFDLVGLTDQNFRPIQPFVHEVHSWNRRWFLHDGITNDLLVDLGHCWITVRANDTIVPGVRRFPSRRLDSSSLARRTTSSLKHSLLTLCIFNTLTSNIKVVFIYFNSNKLAIHLYSSNASCSASHKWIKNYIIFNNI